MYFRWPKVRGILSTPLVHTCPYTTFGIASWRSTLSRSRSLFSLLRHTMHTPGFYGKRKNCYSIAKRAVDKAMQKMYVGRKIKKRDMRSLWISRINAASRLLGRPYSRFINDLAVSDVRLSLIRSVSVSPLPVSVSLCAFLFSFVCECVCVCVC